MACHREDLGGEQLLLAGPLDGRGAVRDVVVERAQKNVVRENAWYASDGAAKGDLGPEEHVAEDAILGRRAQFEQVAGAGDASTPADLAFSAVMAEEELGACFERRAHHAGHLDVFIMNGAPGVGECKLRVSGEEGKDLSSETGVEVVIIGEAEEELAARLLDEKVAVLRNRDGAGMAESSQATPDITGDNCLGIVGGAVVGDDDFDVRRGLGEGALDGAADKMRAVEGGYGDGQAGRHSE